MDQWDTKFTTAIVCAFGGLIALGIAVFAAKIRLHEHVGVRLGLVVDWICEVIMSIFGRKDGNGTQQGVGCDAENATQGDDESQSKDHSEKDNGSIHEHAGDEYV